LAASFFGTTMNKKLLPIWVLFSGTMTFLSFRFYFGTLQDLGLIFALIGLFGLFMIFEIIRKHKDFKLIDDSLIIRQMFRTEKELSLAKIKSWTENNFHFRGQVNRKLILKTVDGDKIDFSDKDDLDEFEKLFHYLRTHKIKIRE
jgi:hypothetical protein